MGLGWNVLLYFLYCVGLAYVEKIMKLGIYVCSFDFRGCGLSEDSPISFGANEKYDIETVVLELNKLGILKIVLWGRSMGAVAAIKYL